MIVTLCGSVAHPELIREAARWYTLDGHLVFAPEPMVGPLTDEQRTIMLPEVHHAKIRRSDLVVVIRKPDGGIGESVRAEAAYAKIIGVPVEYYEPAGKEAL